MNTVKNCDIKNHYAVKIMPSWVPEDYDEIVTENILKINFKPDIFQKQAFYFLQKNESVFISAHTSAGKTLIAEYAVFKSIRNENRVIYTSPIKALSNQKFYDFKQKFDDVGLITGDVQINKNAGCLIMTTEILRNLVYKNSDLLRTTEYVIFDEIHYINDADRGVVWEEAIIMLPKHITIVMLSATIPNAMEFAEWVGRTRNQMIHVIYTDKRPVPLEFGIYCNSTVYAINEIRKGGSQCLTKGGNNKGTAITTNIGEDAPLFTNKVKLSGRFRINDLGNYILNRRLAPAIFFCFSKRSCEEYGRALQNLDATNIVEKKKIQEFISNAMHGINENDASLPQILRMKEQAIRGVAVHHGGLLPFVKECIELLFSFNLIKILIATETFAMGVNMPAKCCVFLNISKIDGNNYRILTGSEFIQMSGRAGRRGMDKVGTVLIADQRNLSIDIIKRLIAGASYDLKSQFKLSFSLILMALRSNVCVEDILRSSFREHGTQKNFIKDMERLKILEGVKDFSCKNCTDIELFLEKISFISKENFIIYKNTVEVDDILILKNNSFVKVLSTNNGVLKVCNIFHKFDKIFKNEINHYNELKNRNECKEITYGNNQINYNDKLNDLENYGINIKTNKYLKYPITCISHHQTETIEIDDIFFLLKKHNNISSNIQVVSKMMQLESAFKEIQELQCLDCPDFELHYYEAIKHYEIKKEITCILNKYDKNSLFQINEYFARIKFLEKRGFYDNEYITLKGKVAAEIIALNEVFVTELIFNNTFAGLDPCSVMAIFSSMIYKSNSVELEEIKIPSVIEGNIELITEAFNQLNKEIIEMGIPSMEELNFSMAGAVYDWCTGKTLASIISTYSIEQEGDFVKLILRLDECCREMINAALIISDKDLENLFTEASYKMKRDIIFMPSLYL